MVTDTILLGDLKINSEINKDGAVSLRDVAPFVELLTVAQSAVLNTYAKSTLALLNQGRTEPLAHLRWQLRQGREATL